MANQTLHSMTQNTTPATTDELYLLDDPSGTPANNRITASNLFRVINGMTADSSPDRTADYVVTYDASASAEKKVLLGNLGGYVLSAGFSNSSPADATTYYFGSWDGLGIGPTNDSRRVYFQRAGKVTKIDVYLRVGSTGSGETSTMSFRLNDTTDTTISSAIEANSTNEHFTNTALSISVAVGDYFEIKWVSPTWVTNPTGVYGIVRVFVE